MKVHVVQKVMKVNDELAEQNRRHLRATGVVAVNLMSAPGSGKTALIETAVPYLRSRIDLGVIEGDPETTLDAERIQEAGVPVVQIETCGGCHLEANLVAQALQQLPLDHIELLIIENVGNLVCPVEFDLGETLRVAVVSVTEGHDKPAKYPKLFRKADLVLLNKVDLLPHVAFDLARFEAYLAQLNPEYRLLQTSCTTGEGIDLWAHWLADQVKLAALQ